MKLISISYWTQSHLLGSESAVSYVANLNMQKEDIIQSLHI